MLLPEPPPPAAPQPEPRPPGRWRRRLRRGVLLLAGAVLLVALLWAGVLAYLNSEGFKHALHEKVEQRLRQRAELIQLGDELRVDWLGRVRMGPLAVRADPEAEPFFTAEGLRVRPSYRLLLVGRVFPATVTFERPVLKVGTRAQEPRRFLEAMRSPSKKGSAAPAEEGDDVALTVYLEGLRLLGGRSNALPLAREVDAWVKVLRQSDGSVRAQGRGFFADGSSVRGQFEWRDGRATVGLLARGLTPGALAEELWQRLPVRATRGAADLTLNAEGGAVEAGARARLSVVADGVWLEGERLAPRPVGPARVGFGAELAWEPEQRQLSLRDARAWIGSEELFVGFDGALELRGTRPLRFEATVKDVPYEALERAIPPQLRPEEGEPSCEGPLHAAFSVKGPLHEPEQWEVEAKLDTKKLKRPKSAGPLFLLGSFEHTAIDAKGRTRNLWIGPESATFVPYAELPEYVVRAVTTSEDAGFFGHQGFDFSEIHDSVVAAVRGTRVRGASTLTQQLAKNLFLSRERTLSRKVKEAMITLALEASVPKERLVEIYLNLIEWGPNLYGVGEAAEHYFGVDARKLSPKQAAFLATIIPNPNRYHFYYDRGALTPTWEQRVATLLGKMHDEGFLDDELYAQALAEPVVFAK